MMKESMQKIIYMFGVTLLTVILLLTTSTSETEYTKETTSDETKKQRVEGQEKLIPPLIKLSVETKQQASVVTTEKAKVTQENVKISENNAQETSTYVVCTYQLNVRNQPSVDGKILHTLKQEDIVIVEEKLPNGWFKLKSGGFVNAKYLSIATNADIHKKLTSRSAKRTVEAASLFVPTKISTKVNEPSNLTSQQLDLILDGTALSGLGLAFKRMEENSNVNALVAIAIAKLESGNGKSKLAQNKNNLFGLNAIDGDAYRKAFHFNSKEECILYFGELLKEKYIDQGRTTLQSINRKYAPSNNHWYARVHQIMKADYSKIIN